MLGVLRVGVAAFALSLVSLAPVPVPCQRHSSLRNAMLWLLGTPVRGGLHLYATLDATCADDCHEENQNQKCNAEVMPTLAYTLWRRRAWPSAAPVRPADPCRRRGRSSTGPARKNTRGAPDDRTANCRQRPESVGSGSWCLGGVSVYLAPLNRSSKAGRRAQPAARTRTQCLRGQVKSLSPEASSCL